MKIKNNENILESVEPKKIIHIKEWISQTKSREHSFDVPLDLIKDYDHSDVSHGKLTNITIYDDYETGFAKSYSTYDGLNPGNSDEKDKIVKKRELELQEIKTLKDKLNTSIEFNSIVTGYYVKNGKYTVVKVVNKEKGIINIGDLVIEFSPDSLKEYLPKCCYGPDFEINPYNGLVGLGRFKTYSNWKDGHDSYNRSASLGLIIDNMTFIPKTISLFINNLAIIKLSPEVVTFYNSTFDKIGHNYFIPENILSRLTTIAESIRKESRIEEKDIDLQLKAKNKTFNKSTVFSKQESINKGMMEIAQEMTELANKHLKSNMSSNIGNSQHIPIMRELLTLSNKSLQIACDFQEFSNMLGLEPATQIGQADDDVGLLGTNITEATTLYSDSF